MTFIIRRAALPFALGALLLGGCTGKDEETDDSSATVSVDPAFLTTYADIGQAVYSDSLLTVTTLRAAVDAFVASPSDETQQDAKDAWLAAREIYGQSEVYRFQGGPIDDDVDGPEGRINSWPMDEAYVDYVEGDADAGIINDLDEYPDLTKEILISLNQPMTVEGGEDAVSLGFHAIEFLLWGQDLVADDAGTRSYTDYLDGAPNYQRRGQYLLLTAEILEADLQQVVDDWVPYREQFLAAPWEESALAVLTGMGSLSGAELSGERMQVAYDTQEQEDEHSCFSDNTHRDIVNDAIGIRGAYLGTYVRLDGTTLTGPSLYHVMAGRNQDLDSTLREQLDASVTTAEAIQAPFDQEILSTNSEGRERVATTIAALLAQTDSIVGVATDLGITLNLE